MQMVQHAIRESKYSRTEVARRAGVSVSTITRIEKGSIDPTLTMASRVLAALNLQMPSPAEPLCMPELITAARSILGGQKNQPAPEAAELLMRWVKPDGNPHPRELAREAGAGANPRLRPGVMRITSNWSFLRVCSAVSATRNRWAASGAPAAVRIGADSTGGPVIIYSENPGQAAASITSARSGAEVIVLPMNSTTESGIWHEEGIVWVDPIQVILDCFGMPETMRQAEQLTRDWEEDHG